MKTEAGWVVPPPARLFIENFSSNLSRFIDMTDNVFGEVLTYDELLLHFA